MFVVQANLAVNIDYCSKIYIRRNEIRAETDVETFTAASFDTAEQAKEYLSLILKAYAAGEKVFYC